MAASAAAAANLAAGRREQRHVNREVKTEESVCEFNSKIS